MVEATNGQAHETVTARFATRTDAAEALDRLRKAGLPVGEARIRDGSDAAGESVDRQTGHEGFGPSLGDLTPPIEGRGIHGEASSRGAALLTLRVSRAHHARAVAILDRDGTVEDGEQQAGRSGAGGTRPAASPGVGDTSLTAPRDDPAMRSGISGIGAHAAGAPPARFASERLDTPGRRVRSAGFEEPAQDGAGAHALDKEDDRSHGDLGSRPIRRTL